MSDFDTNAFCSRLYHYLSSQFKINMFAILLKKHVQKNKKQKTKTLQCVANYFATLLKCKKRTTTYFYDSPTSNNI